MPYPTSLFLSICLFLCFFQVHKRRLKALELEPYSVEESEKAAGHGNFVPAKKRKIETQPSKDDPKMVEDEDL